MADRHEASCTGQARGVLVGEAISQEPAQPINRNVERSLDVNSQAESIELGQQSLDDVATANAEDSDGGASIAEDLGGDKIEGGIAVTDAADLPPEKKKKKKKRKPASKRGLGKPTGMEEFYADAPMTPEEYEEQQRLYDRELSFLDRLLTAIQRFERTRKLTPERRDIFYKWLAFGGIKIAPNIGIGKQNEEGMDKDQIATARSQVQIPNELRNDLESTDSKEPKYAVDFMGCTQSFLSRSAHSIFGFDKKEDVELVTTTIERFLDYLMQCDVCPEYTKEILATRTFCREAIEELWSVAEAQRWLPGDFNIACSTAFEGNYAHNYDGRTVWGDAKDESAVFVGLEYEEAVRIIGFGMAGAASQEVYEKYFELSQGLKDDDAIEVEKVIEGQGFEILDIEDPTADCKDLYKNNSNAYRPVGRVHARAWRNPESPPEDLTREEKAVSQVRKDEPEEYVFFVEEIILQHLSPRQKILATIRKLNCGLWFFDEFVKIYPKFDLYILNELMEDYKEPRYLPNAYVPGIPGWQGSTGSSAGTESNRGSDVSKVDHEKHKTPIAPVVESRDEDRIELC